ncbi:unnamed protein product [Caenorhabditis brenneri]
MSEIEKDYGIIGMLEHTAKTPEEKELLKEARLAVYLADKNAQARNLKRAKNGEPPEEVDSEEDEDYETCWDQRDLTEEERKSLDSNHHPNIHPRILGTCNSILARLYRKPDVSMTEINKKLHTRGLRFSAKTPEEHELVDRVEQAVWEARQYAHQRANVRARHPKGQDEDWEETQQADGQEDHQEERSEVQEQDVDNWGEPVETQEDNWTMVPPLEAGPETQGPDNWGYYVKAHDKDFWAQPSKEDTPFSYNWTQPEPFEGAEPVDNWAAHDAYQKRQIEVSDLERKLRVMEHHAWELAEELKASKEREEEMKKEMEKKSFRADNYASLVASYNKTSHAHYQQFQLSKELMEENYALKKSSQRKEAELQWTVKALEAKLEKSKGALKDQAVSQLKTVHLLADEVTKCRSTIENQEKRIRELEQKIVKIAEQQTKEIIAKLAGKVVRRENN